jgi:hypothetical protein
MDEIAEIESCAVCGEVFPAGWCSTGYDDVTGEPFLCCHGNGHDMPDTLVQQ